MRGLFSLEQELRAIRKDTGPKDVSASKDTPAAKETERPWQRDIDRMQQTIGEMLRAIASLSGVELPGLPAGPQGEGAPPPRVDIKTLKDRIRNELEGFTVRTAAELAKRAKEQTHAALDEIQNEVGGRIEQIAAEIQEEIQHRLEPGQIENDLSKVGKDHIEKLLESRVQEAVVRLERSFQEKVEHLFAGQEQMVQKTLQGALTSVQAQVSKLEQAAQEICELKADLAAQVSAERPKAAVDNAMGKYGSRVDYGVDRLLDQASSRIKWPSHNSQKIQPAQSTFAGVEGRRKVISFDNTEMDSRVQQALENLGRLGLNNPHPESRVEILKATPWGDAGRRNAQQGKRL